MINNLVLFVDAGFLSKLSKYFGGETHLRFDYFKFFYSLAEKKGLNLKKVFYYTAPPFLSNNPCEEDIFRKRGYDKFISKLKKKDFIEVREGRVQRLINSKNEIEFHQKGVDTLMTLDLAFVRDRFENIEVMLITSDTDFCPVINELVQRGIKVNLLTYNERKKRSDFLLSHHLVKSCSSVEYLKKEDLEEFTFLK
jgi:uncharacterized LabA/DUF88 family protein